VCHSPYQPACFGSLEHPEQQYRHARADDNYDEGKHGQFRRTEANCAAPRARKLHVQAIHTPKLLDSTLNDQQQREARQKPGDRVGRSQAFEHHGL
jgi:hypothetical protein